jgi:ATP/ADP translocase
MILILFLKIFYIMNNSNIFAPIYQQLSGCLSPLECNRIRLNWFNKLFINLLHI